MCDSVIRADLDVARAIPDGTESTPIAKPYVFLLQIEIFKCPWDFFEKVILDQGKIRFGLFWASWVSLGRHRIRAAKCIKNVRLQQEPTEV